MKYSGKVENGELWIRCPFCGDSEKNPNKAHFSVKLTNGLYYCLRCNASGKLTTSQLLSLVDYGALVSLEEIDEEPETTEFPDLTPGPASSRDSKLERWRLFDAGGDFDAFYIYDPRTKDHVGMHFRRGREGRTLGERKASWPNAPSPLVSSPSDPLRIVEGPYDVLEENDVCIYGMISRSSIADFQGHYLVLCPDGDVWEDQKLLKRFLKTVNWALHAKNLFLLQGIEFIAGGLDPDEAPVETRQLISRYQIGILLKEAREAWK